jgi:ribonuclease P protein component
LPGGSRDEGRRDASFPKTARLRSARDYRDFRRLPGKNRTALGPFSILAAENGLDRSRLGLAVGRKSGGAVVRSRLKRLAREYFRRELKDRPPHRDYLFIAQPRQEDGAAGKAIRKKEVRRLRLSGGNLRPTP